MLRNTALRTCTVAVFFLWAALANRSIFAANDASASAHRDWTTVGGGNGNERYSSLSQINVGNVARLKGVWVRELGSKTRTPPVVVNGVIYTNDAARIYALNAKTGASIWEYAPKKSTPARGGVAVAEGKVFCGLLDGHVVALDLQNGKLVWTGYIGNAPEGEKADAPKINLAPDTPSFDPKVGLITAAPTYADGKIILGLSGGDGGTRSKVAALDAATGKVLWQWWVAPAAGEPGSETWPADGEARQLGGGLRCGARIDLCWHRQCGAGLGRRGAGR
jgi:alcohol dehydrogenase (cytochrome c)